MAEIRLPISGSAFIAANEAHRIRGALESVAPWTSEIIVVLNDDVNDGTDKIAESSSARKYFANRGKVTSPKKIPLLWKRLPGTGF